MEQPIFKPVSEKQLAANRANALKSTGPKTSNGKRRSASNALKHGLYSENLLSLFNEDRTFHVNLVENLITEYQPVTPTEHILVQQLATLQARFVRAQKHYLELLNDQAELMQPALAERFPKGMSSDARYALAYKQEANSGRALESLLRELDRLPLKIRKTIEMLVWYRQQPGNSAPQQDEESKDEIEPISDLPPTPSLSVVRDSPLPSSVANLQQAIQKMDHNTSHGDDLTQVGLQINHPPHVGDQPILSINQDMLI